MKPWYPLQFQPLFRRYLWGGRRLFELLQKPLGEGHDYAESWEVVDRGDDQSVVTVGPWQGTTLHELVTTHGRELFGSQPVPPRFPLLLKFLDAHTDLSVQVHPDDARGARLVPPDLGKTEAWYILHAEPGSKVYAGLRAGCGRGEFVESIATGRTAECLHVCEPQAGDCLFIPAGTVHALGAGLVVAEIQQASDTTYRLFDWNRVGPDGKPRALHIEQGIEAINFDAGPVSLQSPQKTSLPFVDQLVSCDRFVLNRWRWSGTKSVPRDQRCRIMTVVAGQAVATGSQFEPVTLGLGEVMLVPAAVGDMQITGENTTLLEMYLP